jgi:hypothetical protein
VDVTTFENRSEHQPSAIHDYCVGLMLAVNYFLYSETCEIRTPLGRAKSVPNSEVSSFHRAICSENSSFGPDEVSLFHRMSSFRRVAIHRFHCIYSVIYFLIAFIYLFINIIHSFIHSFLCVCFFVLVTDTLFKDPGTPVICQHAHGQT